jgi:hypothetical protein
MHPSPCSLMPSSSSLCISSFPVALHSGFRHIPQVCQCRRHLSRWTRIWNVWCRLLGNAPILHLHYHRHVIKPLQFNPLHTHESFSLPLASDEWTITLENSIFPCKKVDNNLSFLFLLHLAHKHPSSLYSCHEYTVFQISLLILWQINRPVTSTRVAYVSLSSQNIIMCPKCVKCMQNGTSHFTTVATEPHSIEQFHTRTQ